MFNSKSGILVTKIIRRKGCKKNKKTWKGNILHFSIDLKIDNIVSKKIYSSRSFAHS